MMHAQGKQTKKDHIANELRSLLATGEIQRGERVSQDALAQRFDASVTPVREALQQLEAEGLLESEPGRGHRVVAIDLERAKSIYIARRLLETHAIERASQRVSRRDLARAEGHVDLLAEAAARDDIEAVWEANRLFHFGLYDRAELPSLVGLIRNLWITYPWDLFRITARFEQSVDDHRQIVAALAGGELSDARDAIGVHIARGYLGLARRLGGLDVDPPDPIAIDVD
jgi:DNA-binding GntR family transcriptional regulator